MGDGRWAVGIALFCSWCTADAPGVAERREEGLCITLIFRSQASLLWKSGAPQETLY